MCARIAGSGRIRRASDQKRRSSDGQPRESHATLIILVIIWLGITSAAAVCTAHYFRSRRIIESCEASSVVRAETEPQQDRAETVFLDANDNTFEHRDIPCKIIDESGDVYWENRDCSVVFVDVRDTNDEVVIIRLKPKAKITINPETCPIDLTYQNHAREAYYTYKQKGQAEFTEWLVEQTEEGNSISLLESDWNADNWEKNPALNHGFSFDLLEPEENRKSSPRVKKSPGSGVKKKIEPTARLTGVEESLKDTTVAPWIASIHYLLRYDCIDVEEGDEPGRGSKNAPRRAPRRAPVDIVPCSYQLNFASAGTLISDRWVITTFSSIRDYLEDVPMYGEQVNFGIPENLLVIFGNMRKHPSDNPNQLLLDEENMLYRRVESLVWYPDADFNPWSAYYDPMGADQYITRREIKLVRLESPVVYTDYIKPICLQPVGYGGAYESDYPWSAQNLNKYVLQVYGYGEAGESEAEESEAEESEPLETDDPLRTIELFPVPQEICDLAYPTNRQVWPHDDGYEKRVCARNTETLDGIRKDLCHHDLGNPLVQQLENEYRLVGVAIDYRCGVSEKPSQYYDIDFYADWIHQTIAHYERYHDRMPHNTMPEQSTDPADFD